MKYHVALGLFFCFIAQSLFSLPAQITFIRSAETETEGGALSTKGKVRVAAYVPYFTDTKELTLHGPPVAIYVIGGAKDGEAASAAETVKPLADSLKLTIKTAFSRDDFKKMVDEIKKDVGLSGKNVLICWDSAQIPEITRAFGAFQSLSTWRKDDYDHVWIVTFASNGKASFQRLPQKLLFGDSPR